MQAARADTLKRHPGASTPLRRQQASNACSSSAQDALRGAGSRGLTLRYRSLMGTFFAILSCPPGSGALGIGWDGLVLERETELSAGSGRSFPTVPVDTQQGWRGEQAGDVV